LLLLLHAADTDIADVGTTIHTTQTMFAIAGFPAMTALLTHWPIIGLIINIIATIGAWMFITFMTLS